VRLYIVQAALTIHGVVPGLAKSGHEGQQADAWMQQPEKRWKKEML
jgi:hypothetical protein